MRRLVLASALVVGATACNWAFGLSATQTWDAGDAAPDSPPGIRTRLVWGAVTTDGMGDPDATITYAGIGSETTRPATPVIQVGPLDATQGPLVAAPYDTSDGSFEIPYTLREAPHRIVYTLPGDSTPHEVQWSVTGATIVVPRYARMEAPLVPPNSGFTITPTNALTFMEPRVYTSGVFNLNDDTSQIEGAATPSTTLRYSEKANPLALPTGAIQGSKGDWVLVTDWGAGTNGEIIVVSWALAKNIDLAPSTLSVPSPQPPYANGERTLATSPCPSVNCWPVFNPSNAEGRMNSLGALVDQSTHKRLVRYGIVPSAELPPILPGAAPGYIDRSTILYFVEAYQTLTSVKPNDPSSLLAYPRAVWARLTATRTTNGVTLTTSMQETVKDLTSGQNVLWKAPLAKSIMLGSTNLSGADDAAFPASTTQTTLSFTADQGTAHDFVITLYELANNAITPVRIYHVTAPTAKIDASLLQTGHRYVLGITSRVGFPMAAQGDYRTVTWPFSNSTTMAATFVVQ